MKKGSYWFSFLTEKQQSEFRANIQPSEKFYELMEASFEDFESFISFDIATSIPIVQNHFHIVYMTGENKCTGVNIKAVDMIDALEQFESKNNNVKPIYCYAK